MLFSITIPKSNRDFFSDFGLFASDLEDNTRLVKGDAKTLSLKINQASPKLLNPDIRERLGQLIETIATSPYPLEKRAHWASVNALHEIMYLTYLLLTKSQRKQSRCSTEQAEDYIWARLFPDEPASLIFWADEARRDTKAFEV